MTLLAQLKARRGTLPLEVELKLTSQCAALTGPNGAGKTSLLLLLLGLSRPDGGRIQLGEQVLFDASLGIDVPSSERGLGYVPQQLSLFPHLSVRGNVEFGARRLARSKQELRARADEALHWLSLEKLAHRRPATLSGGEAQRVALARCLASGPAALLWDEPLAAIDASARIELRAQLAERLAELKLPALVVTHDGEDARALGQEVWVMEAGKIVQKGHPDQLRAQPATPYVARLFS